VDTNRTFNVLLAEDNPIDVIMTKEGLGQWTLKHRLHVVEHGEAAVDFLLRRGNYVGVERPDLVILDLNLPRKNGAEVLSVIKDNPDFENLKVVIVTTSAAGFDSTICTDLGVKLCITKPLDFHNYVQAIKSIEEFWLG
jgi:CheY-like chemotaxis protein